MRTARTKPMRPPGGTTRIRISRAPGVWPVTVQKVTKYAPDHTSHASPPATAATRLMLPVIPNTDRMRLTAPPRSRAMTSITTTSISSATARVTSPAYPVVVGARSLTNR